MSFFTDRKINKTHNNIQQQHAYTYLHGTFYQPTKKEKQNKMGEK
jgi:hypothetical protein